MTVPLPAFFSPRLFLFYFLFILLCFFAMKIGWLIPDGAAYCSYNASLILDGDLNFWNQYRTNGIITQNLIHGSTVTGNGYVVVLWTIGAPILWMLFWVVGHMLTIAGPWIGQTWAPSGFTIYYNFGVRFGTAIMGLCALTMNYWLIRRYVEKQPALWAVVFVAIGTPYYWYMFHFADMAHVPVSFAISLFLLVWQAYSRGSRTVWNSVLVGMVGGFVTITKPNHIFIFLFPLLFWVSRIKKGPTREILSEICGVSAGLVMALFLQFWIWQILFGNPLGPILDKGVTHYYKFFTGHFWLPDILFSSYHGLLFFSPVLIFSFWGLIRMVKIDSLFAIPALTILVLELLLMASERFFWEGVAFGLRRVVDWTPLFVVGMAAAMHNLQGKWKVVPMAAVLWTILLMFTYSHRPTGLLNEYQPPSLILSWMFESLEDLPATFPSYFSLPAPAKTFLPAMLVFAPLGYMLFYGMLRLAASASIGKIPKVLSIVLLVGFIVGYALVGRAAIRSEASKQQYASELEWLAQKQERIQTAEEVTFLLNEGKYLALTRNWPVAKPSFAEAIKLSPDPEATRLAILQFVRRHMPPAQAMQYIDSI